MSSAPAVVRRAPGKLFVAGEYAVVEPGHSALLVAVDRYVTVTATAAARPGVTVSSDLGPHEVHWTWRDGTLRLSGPGDESGLREKLVHVLSAVETVHTLLAEHGLPAPQLALTVRSDLHEGGRKFGLGSSGAVTVATIEAVAEVCELALTREQVFRLALVTGAGIDIKGSGGDLAAAVWGGWLAYRAPDRAHVLDLVHERGIGHTLRAPWPGFQARPLPPPAGLSLEVGWTGTPASTTSLVADLHRRTWRGTPTHERFLAASAEFVDAAAAAIEAGDAPGVQQQIRRARQELSHLDDAVGLGIFTPQLTALCSIAEADGGAAKPSGAGGGDCGIALFATDAPDHIAHVRDRWAAAGVTPLPVSPAVKGIEE
ncbi:mevalonate kinase [Streptomyces sp. YIM 130001]|uniref:phosphomevalonate kinase n=1 Tax=Streptomyces sp. YIM 130001 TaxID=2259644 RepID=UPI000E64CAC5|nr:phosphomevalonate kinase [Streptomyces sp. YIM 130001]RII13486.1 mevalonate kinase [Streptomyces sp. YIM 130001]